MWFEIWSNNSKIPVIIIYLYTTLFQSFRFLTNGHFQQGFPVTNSVPIRNPKMFIVTVGFVS